MDDLTLNLIMITLFALVGGGIWVLVRTNQAQNAQQIARMAAQHGWTVTPIREPLAWGLRLSSARWTLEAISRSSGKETAPGSTDTSMHTVWQSNAPGSLVLIGPRTSQVNLGALGEALTRQVLQMALGAEANGLNEVQLGSEAFQQKYILLAQNAAEAKTWLNAELEAALLNWQGAPLLIKRTSTGLSLELRGVRLQKPADLLALAALGERFIATNR